jgi:hypothetical protein
MIAKAQNYEAIQIFIDGGSFTDCNFKNCTMVYSGLMQAQFQGCRFDDCRWTFSGAARNTLDFLAIIYSMGEVGKDMVENTFQTVKEVGKKRAEQRRSRLSIN